jgi:hypothetical protein
MTKAPRILYFLTGPVPTEAERKDAVRYGSGVTYRNANLVPSEGATEACDGVAGTVPPLYKDKPNGAEVIKAYLQAIDAEPVEKSIPPIPPVNDGWGKEVTNPS